MSLDQAAYLLIRLNNFFLWYIIKTYFKKSNFILIDTYLHKTQMFDTEEAYCFIYRMY